MTSAFVVQGDCLDVLKTFPDASISAVVTDPPYGLSKEPDMLEVLRHWLAEGETYRHKGGGFMGKSWDSFVPSPEVWREVLRVLKPGGHALVFSGTRTYDLTVLAMRIAGFEIRDQLAWIYGQGMPKGEDVARDIDMHLCELPGRHCDKNLPKGDKGRPGDHLCPPHPMADAHRGENIALKPAQEPIVLARKPLCGTVAANVLRHGTGGLNIDGCRIGTEARYNPPVVKGWNPDGTYSGRDAEGKDVVGRWPANVLLDETAAEVLDGQTGDVKGQQSGTTGNEPSDRTASVYSRGTAHKPTTPRGDTGGASRFFYVAKTSRAEREAGLDHLPKHSAGELTEREDGSDGLKSPRAGAGRTSAGRANNHPTVKPIALMRHLVRLITPPGGMLLDPFAGSGSTLCAAVLEGVDSVGIELTPEYIPIIEGRIAHYKAHGEDAPKGMTRAQPPLDEVVALAVGTIAQGMVEVLE